MTVTDPELRQRIITELGVVDPDTFDAKQQVAQRISFLTDYLRQTGAKGYVLGISGGVDSTTTGRLAQLACEAVRELGAQASFVAIRLPYRVQADESDAQAALDFIAADEVMTVNIGPAVDAQWGELLAAGMPDGDFNKGNVKARQRMVAQYAVAGARGLLVLGTDHAAEAVVGFYTKFGDGACDLTPLAGLTKRRVREVAAHLGAPAHLVGKIPTADLEDAKPLIADEVALGVRYEQVDDYLEGKTVSAQAEQVITEAYQRSAHKRALPVAPQRT